MIIRIQVMAENAFNSGAVKEYSDIESEAPETSENLPVKTWLNKGGMTFKNVVRNTEKILTLCCAA